MKKILLFLLIFPLLSSAFPEAGFDLRNVKFIPSPANPGSAVTVQATLVHTGTLSYYNVTLTPEYVFPFTEGTKEQVIPRMDPGQRFPVTFTFNVSSDAEASVYPLEINVVNWNVEYGDRAEKQFRISVPVSSTPSLIISSTEFTGLEPGSKFRLAFNVNNTASIQTGSIKAVLSVNNDPGFLFYTSNPLVLEGIPGKRSREIVFSGQLSPNAAPGTYKGTLKISTQSGDFEFPVYLLVKGQSGLTVSSVNSGLAVGNKGVLSFNFQNPLSTELTNVHLTINPEFKYYTEEPEQFFERIPAKGTAEASYHVFVDRDVSPGAYDVTVTLSSDQITRKTTIPVLVKGIPKLSLSSVSYDVDRITANQPVLLSIQIENVGTGDARNIRMTVTGLSGQGSQEIGTVEKDDTGTGVFDTKFTEPGNKKLKVLVQYDDEYGEAHSAEFTAEVYVNPAPADYSMIILLAVAIVFALLYFSRKQRRKKWLKKVF